MVAPTKALAGLADFLDKSLVPGLVQLVAFIPQFAGRREVLGRAQDGLIQHYLGVTAFSVGFLLIVLMFAI